MPDFAVHTLFGEELLPIPQVQLLVAGERELPAFFWGLQGPDFFFFRPDTSVVASLMHREKPGALLFALVSSVCAMEPGPERDTALAWFGGFLCHYALDRQVHPYVYGVQNQILARSHDKSPTAVHFQVETDMDEDLYLLRHGRPISRMNPAQGYALALWQKQAIGKTVCAALYQAYGVSITMDQGVKALSAMAAAQQLIFRGGKPLHFLARGAELVSGKRGELTGHIKAYHPGWDSLNLGHAPWFPPASPQEPSTLSVPELMAQAYTQAQALLEEFGAMVAANRPQYRFMALDFSGNPVSQA